MIRRPEAGKQAGEQVVSFTCHVTMKFMRRSQKILSCIARVRRELELENLCNQEASFKRFEILMMLPLGELCYAAAE